VVRDIKGLSRDGSTCLTHLSRISPYVASCNVFNLLTNHLAVSNLAKWTCVVALPSNWSTGHRGSASANCLTNSSLLLNVLITLLQECAHLFMGIFLAIKVLGICFLSILIICSACLLKGYPLMGTRCCSIPFLPTHLKTVSKLQAVTNCLEAATSCLPLSGYILEGYPLTYVYIS
jgi:hypothetical protein